MELYYSFSVLIVLAAIFSYVNARYLKLPSTIGIMVIAMLTSLGLVMGGQLFPKTFDSFLRLFGSIDFSEILMGCMLNFLLFAGAIHIHLEDLKQERLPVLLFSTVSVIISTFIVGYLMYYILYFLNFNIPLIQCLLFGSLISPTDPIAVLGILKKAKVAKSLETKVAGESLFNDGMAVVMFILLNNIANGEEVNLTFVGISTLLIKEAIGGIVLGLCLGFLGSIMIKQVDDYKVDVLITLAIVMGGYLIAHQFHMSGPLAMVAAGLIVGNFGRNRAMSETSREYVDKFWELTDEVMNAILFLFIGFEILLIEEIRNYWAVGMITILVVLFARFISIIIPVQIIKFKENKFTRQSIIILVWGGLRGGVSIALASSIAPELNRDLFLTITYFVVVFSIIVQGLTIGKVTQPKKKLIANS